MAKKQYHIITFGCQMNKSDSERIAAFLEKNGWKKSLETDRTDLMVVNMCSVRQSAVDRVYGLIPKIKNLRKGNPNLKVVLTGCILDKDKKKLGQKFAHILKKEDLIDWQKIISGKIKKGNRKIGLSSYFRIKPAYSSPFQAFVPISNGCNLRCSYCAVPFTRGKEINRGYKDILTEVKNLTKSGYKEIWLLGQIVNSYRDPVDQRIRLAYLIKEINSFSGDFWLRFTSPHPIFFNEELIEAMAKSEKFNPYINLPVQSGNNDILKKMRRGYTAGEYTSLVKKIRKAFQKYRQGLEKNIALSTDIIVGFPGETEKQFEDTAKLFREIEFDMAYISPYSPRPGTEAAKMEDNVPKEEKKRREKKLNQILRKSALKRNRAFVGENIIVLASEYKNGFLSGKSFHYKTARFKGEKNLLGQFLKVKVTKALIWGLEGKVINTQN